METMAEADRLAARLIEGFPITQRRLDLAGVSTVVLEAGEGPPIVLLHGQGGFGAFWAPLMAFLSGTHRVIAPDLPGLGRSVVQRGSLDAAGLVAWLGDLIAKTCDQPPVILGASLGGSIAARFAIKRPDELSRLILVGSGSLGKFRPSPRVLIALIRFMKNPNEAGAERMQRQIFYDADSVRALAGNRMTMLRDAQIERARVPSVTAANRALLRGIGTKRLSEEELRSIRVPVALIWGRHDRVNQHKIAARASAALAWPLQTIDGAGHAVMAEKPTEFMAALREAMGEGG